MHDEDNFALSLMAVIKWKKFDSEPIRVDPWPAGTIASVGLGSEGQEAKVLAAAYQDKHGSIELRVCIFTAF